MVGKEQVDLFTGARSNNVALVDAAIRRGAQINWQFDRWEGPSWGLKVPIHVFGVYWGVNVRERWRAPPGVEVSRGDTLLIIALKLGMSDLVRRICRCEDLRCELKNEAGNDAWAIAELVHMSQWLPPLNSPKNDADERLARSSVLPRCPCNKSSSADRAAAGMAATGAAAADDGIVRRWPVRCCPRNATRSVLTIDCCAGGHICRLRPVVRTNGGAAIRRGATRLSGAGGDGRGSDTAAAALSFGVGLFTLVYAPPPKRANGYAPGGASSDHSAGTCCSLYRRL
ncbi:unnamed protein product [Phaeothamnion confervicola]